MAFIPQVDTNIPLSGRDPLVEAQRGFTLGQEQLQSGRETQAYNQQQATQRALRDLAGRVDMSTPEGQADFVRQAYRIDPNAGMQAQQAFQSGALKQADITLKQEETKRATAQTEDIGAQAKLRETQLKTEFIGDLSSNMQQIVGKVDPLFKNMPVGSPGYTNALKVANDEAHSRIEQLKNKYSAYPEFTKQLEQLDAQEKDWHSPEEIKQHLGMFQGLQAQAKQQLAESPEGKLVDDFKAGRITKEQLDKALTKKESLPISIQMVNAPSPVTKQNESLQGEEFLKTVPPQLANQARAVGEYRTKLPALSTRNPENKRIRDAVFQAYPDYQEQQFSARNSVLRDFTSGPTAKNITAINTAIGHMGTLNQAADALQNGNVQGVNQFINYAKTQLGHPEANNFNLARQAVGNELMRVFRQVGASETETKDFEERISSAQSPQQLHGAIKEASELLESRINALKDQWERGMGDTKNMPNIVSPHSQEVLSGLKGTQKQQGAYEDKDKETRYQEWKKSHGY